MSKYRETRLKNIYPNLPCLERNTREQGKLEYWIAMSSSRPYKGEDGTNLNTSAADVNKNNDDKKSSNNSSSSSNNNNNNNNKSPAAFLNLNLDLSGPRDDFIGILADRVVKVINENYTENGPIIQQTLEKFLPSTKETIRTDLPFYNSTVDILKYQRDNYLIGTKYAEQKQHYRQRQFPFTNSRFGAAIGSPRMPNDATALGYIQIVQLGSWFVPSKTIKDALLPIVILLPSGVLHDTITSTVSDAIPLAQPIVDSAMKDAVLGVINDPQIRQLIKSRTQKILRVNDDENNNNDNDKK
jgi:hypothetical protein